ncbi:PAS domain S-box protein [candidate division KSB1 bacterium]|nr:PAS domain S-box protein [candidate division KSB1 bacterium]
MTQKTGGMADELFEHSEDGIIVLDSNGVILSANPKAIALLGFVESELVGQSYSWVFFHETQNQGLSQLLNDGLKRAKEYRRREIEYQTPAGLMHRLQVSTSVFSRQDDIGKLLDRESLVVYFKVVSLGSSEKTGVAGERARESLDVSFNVLEQRNRQLLTILQRHDTLKLVLAGLIFFIVFLVVFYAKNAITVIPDTFIARESEQMERRVVTAVVDTVEMDVVFAGLIEPHHKLTLAAQTSGTVVRRGFEEGDHVPQGHILYQMDTKELAKNVRAARVKYMELLEQYNMLANWEESLEVMQARRKFELSKIALRNEQKKLAETKKLFEKGIIPRVEYEEAETKYKETEYNFENARQSLDAVLDRGSADKLQILQLRLSNAREELEEVEARYEATLIRAPVAGIVLRPEREDGSLENFKNIGDLVNDGDLVATIGATESYIINSFVGELTVRHLKAGQEAEIALPAAPGVRLPGRVDWVGTEATMDGRYKAFPVRLILPGVPDSLRREIRFGLSARATVVVRRFLDALTVPVEAVEHTDNEYIVYLYQPDGSIEPRPIIPGYSDRFRVIIESGLEAGEKVVVQAHDE